GLTYRILDENGKKIGVPIKASDFYIKPTLKYLQAKFQQNETVKLDDKVRVKNAVDLALIRQPNHSIESLVKSLEKEAISAVLRKNKEGIIYGITYVDHRTKSVFNGSDLGKQYSAKGIEERCKHIEKLQPTQITTQQAEKQIEPQNQTINKEQKNNFEQRPASAISKALDDLLQPSQSNNYMPNELKKIKKKKRKHISHRL
ncbi:MAG: relaxase/mobilization nuclease domain-containing protein, partial [Segetibacter sp.]